MLEDRAVERALVVVAHPDDADFGAAGTIASWTAAGTAVTYLLCTDGDAGGFDPAVERALVVVAHPDDADFGAAGTIASWMRPVRR